MSAPLLSLDRVTIRYGAEPAVNGVDLAIAPGEIVTLIGPNGSGKTSIVRAALGLLAPDEGAVTTAPGLRIGYVPQDWHVEDTLPITVRRFLTLRGAKSKADLERALEEVGAAHVIDSPLQHLSGGESRRVLLARALLRDPDLLVLDEPMAAVDVTGRAELYRLIRLIRDRRGCGVLLVSHDLHLVMAETDRVLCLNRHVCCSGTPESVLAHPEYLALFGPRLGRELAVYTHHHDHDHDLHGRALEQGGCAPDGQGDGPGDV
ncbi:MAG: zinc ABC transporter ATP-binding protein ZnuC [Rhodospirillaceae bacterium]|jgi:zinc transport system ATP-binding protein|nr:zinc ABC transporter ATP-binding protein ZnuC [Rhodospirillaceae bacterium]